MVTCTRQTRLYGLSVEMFIFFYSTQGRGPIAPARFPSPGALLASHGIATVQELGTGQELGAFVNSHYINGYEPRADAAIDEKLCAASSCGLANWVIQLQELTLRLHQRSGEHFSVHVYSPCAPLLKDLRRVSAKHTPLVLHRAHAGVLVNATQRLRHDQDAAQVGGMIKTLHKWEIVSMVRAQVVIFLDMDIEVLPHLALQGTADLGLQVERVASDWLRLLRCARASPRRLHSFPDFSSPVNAAIMLVRPDLALYRAGLDVLRQAAGRPFDRKRGWEGLGPPLTVTPKGDDAWRRRRGHMQMLDLDTHDFVGASIDQGFFFHMMRVRAALGGVPPAPRAPHRSRANPHGAGEASACALLP